MQSTLLSPADYEAFVAAHPELGLSLPLTRDQQARLAPVVGAWKASEQQQPANNNAAAAIAGILGLGGAAALTYGLLQNRQKEEREAAARAAAPEATKPSSYSFPNDTEFAPDGTVRPLRNPANWSLTAFGKSGSGVDRATGGSRNQLSIFRNPKIGPLVAAGNYDAAKEVIEVSWAGQPEQRDELLRSLDAYFLGLDAVTEQIRGEFINSPNGGAEIRVVDGDRSQVIRPTDGALVTVVDGSGRKTRFAAIQRRGRLIWEPSTPEDFAKKVQAKVDAGQGKLDTISAAEASLQRPKGYGVWRSGLNINEHNPADNRTFIRAQPQVDQVNNALTAKIPSDPLNEKMYFETLPTGSGNTNADRGVFVKVSGDFEPVPIGEPGEIISDDERRRRAPAAALQSVKYGKQIVLRPRTFGELPEAARDKFIAVYDVDGKGTSRLVPVRNFRHNEPLSNVVPASRGLNPIIELYDSDDQGQTDDYGIPVRPRLAYSTDDQGRLIEWVKPEAPVQTTMQKGGVEPPAPEQNYSQKAVNILDYRPSRVEAVATSGLGGNYMRKVKLNSLPNPKDPQYAKKLAFRINEYAKVAATAARARDLDRASRKKFARPGVREAELLGLARAAIFAVTPETDRPLVEKNLNYYLFRVANKAQQLLENGAYAKQDPTPWKATKDDVFFDEQTNVIEENGVKREVKARRIRQIPILVRTREDLQGVQVETTSQNKAVRAADLIAKTLLYHRAKNIPLPADWEQRKAKILRVLGVAPHQVEQVWANQRAAATAEPPERNLTQTKPVGGRSASDFAYPKGYREGRPPNDADEDIRRAYGLRWAEPEFWRQQLVSSLGAINPLTPDATNRAIVSGKDGDLDAVARTLVKQVPQMVEEFADELDGLNEFERYSAVTRALVSGVQDYSKAVDWAGRSKDWRVRKLAERATTMGIAGTFQADNFLKQYVGDFLALEGVARNSRGDAPAKVRVSAEGGLKLVGLAKQRKATGKDIINVLNDELGGTTPSQSLLNLRALTKGNFNMARLGDIHATGKPRNEPYVTAATLSRAFFDADENDLAGTNIGKLLYDADRDIGFNVPLTPEFTPNNTRAGALRYVWSPLFTSQVQGASLTKGGFNPDRAAEDLLSPSNRERDELDDDGNPTGRRIKDAPIDPIMNMRKIMKDLKMEADELNARRVNPARVKLLEEAVQLIAEDPLDAHRALAQLNQDAAVAVRPSPRDLLAAWLPGVTNPKLAMAALPMATFGQPGSRLERGRTGGIIAQRDPRSGRVQFGFDDAYRGGALSVEADLFPKEEAKAVADLSGRERDITQAMGDADESNETSRQVEQLAVTGDGDAYFQERQAELLADRQKVAELEEVANTMATRYDNNLPIVQQKLQQAQVARAALSAKEQRFAAEVEASGGKEFIGTTAVDTEGMRELPTPQRQLATSIGLAGSSEDWRARQGEQSAAARAASQSLSQEQQRSDFQQRQAARAARADAARGFLQKTLLTMRGTNLPQALAVSDALTAPGGAMKVDLDDGSSYAIAADTARQWGETSERSRRVAASPVGLRSPQLQAANALINSLSAAIGAMEPMQAQAFISQLVKPTVGLNTRGAATRSPVPSVSREQLEDIALETQFRQEHEQAWAAKPKEQRGEYVPPSADLVRMAVAARRRRSS